MPHTKAKPLVTRYFTQDGKNVFDTVGWEIRDALITDGENIIFEQKDVEFPTSWSQQATNIVAQKYFRGKMDSPDREQSVRQMVGRVAKTITAWGVKQGYFESLPGTDAWGDEAHTFRDELTHILLNQMAAFNSPVWFNVGFEESPQISACFILSVEDTLEDILDWNTREGNIFRGGSGAGVSLGKLRGSMEFLSKGGHSSGPVSFMRGADAWAGSISSGGKTRRAAKMVVLPADHPDIIEFVWCKAKEEQRLAHLKQIGLIKGIDETAAVGSYQNANNTVRVTDDFMERATGARPQTWDLLARGHHDGTNKNAVVATLDPHDLLMDMAKAAWQCACPGVQYDDTINHWHTSPSSGRINASNPCSEYMHIDDSACNLASINLLKLRNANASINIEALQHITDVMTTAMDILIDPASYPDSRIKENAHTHRQLGLGFANLGALLMANGHPYEAEEGRQLAGALTSLICARAYRQSGVLANRMGPYKAWATTSPEAESNAEAHQRVIEMHKNANSDLKSSAVLLSGNASTSVSILEAASMDWDAAYESAQSGEGLRNAQATVLAPTGTISFLMDCDTTGIEPDFSLVKFKDLAGGGKMTIVNRTVRMALENLGPFSEEAIAEAEQALANGKMDHFKEVVGLDYEVFKTANEISWKDHILMMASCQPFLSGAISKTVNMPETATKEEIYDAYVMGWKVGTKALCIYRNGSKGAQPLSSEQVDPSPKEAADPAPVRRRLPKDRESLTHKAVVGQMEFYITAGKYEDGTLGEVFFTDAGKEGSLVSGIANEWARTISYSLQYGVPLEDLVLKFIGSNYEPSGVTGNKEIPFASSISDYVAKWLASRFCTPELQHQIGLRTPAALEIEEGRQNLLAPPPIEASSVTVNGHIGPTCNSCGNIMQQAGSCHTCPRCGDSSGCG